MGKGASARFSEQSSIWHAIIVLIKAWYAALEAVPNIYKRRRAFTRLKRVGRFELYRLFCAFRMSAREIALKE
jgi:hypothetical protein